MRRSRRRARERPTCGDVADLIDDQALLSSSILKGDGVTLRRRPEPAVVHLHEDWRRFVRNGDNYGDSHPIRVVAPASDVRFS